jgi:hypothetical protein
MYRRPPKAQAGDTIAIAVYPDSSSTDKSWSGRPAISFPPQASPRGLTPERRETPQGAVARQYTADLDVTVTLVTTGRMEDDLKPLRDGRVSRPGPTSFARAPRAAAIAMAGDLGRSRRRAHQVRREVNGAGSVIVFDYRSFEAGTNLENIELRANDVIIVPERRLFSDA